MFATLPGFWTPVMPARALGRRPVALEIASERIVLFRGANGAAALIDRCPHRGVALSLGEVVDGCLECPFHGWRFQGDGACAHVPLNPAAKKEQLGATALPTREAGGLIWVFTGTATETEPVVPEALERKGVRRSFVVESWRTHWTRAMENMLDVPHLPYVHRRTIGRDMRQRLRADSQVVQEITETATGFELRFGLDDGPRARLDWLVPNGMVLHIMETPTRLLRMHVWCIPESTDRTRMLIASVQDFGLFTPFAALGDWFNRRIVTEDRAVVESSQPREVPIASEEQSVATDKATLRFRRWYHRTLTAQRTEGASPLLPLRRRETPRASEAG